MKIGFTGTREGMWCVQHDAMESVLMLLLPVEQWHHGAAIGADAQFSKLVKQAWHTLIVAHPSNRSDQTSSVALACSDEVHQPRPPLTRNHSIVNAVDILVACPASMDEVWRSGTWATIRYARKVGKPITICWPDGSVTREQPCPRSSGTSPKVY